MSAYFTLAESGRLLFRTTQMGPIIGRLFLIFLFRFPG